MKSVATLLAVIALSSCAQRLEERKAEAVPRSGAAFREICRIPCRWRDSFDSDDARFTSLGSDLLLQVTTWTGAIYDHDRVLFRLRPREDRFEAGPPIRLCGSWQNGSNLDVVAGPRPLVVYNDLRDGHRPSDEVDYLNIRDIGSGSGSLRASGSWVAYGKGGVAFIHMGGWHLVVARLEPNVPRVIASVQVHGAFSFGDSQLYDIVSTTDRAWILYSFENELFLREAADSGWNWGMTLQERSPSPHVHMGLRDPGLVVLDGRPLAAWIDSRGTRRWRVVSVPEDGPAVLETLTLDATPAPDPPGHEGHG